MATQTDAFSGQGTIFNRSGTPISEIKSIENTKSRETIEVTKLSDTDGYRRFIGGLRDAGSITMEMHFVRANYDLLNADYESDEEQAYSIEFSDDANTTFSFDGLVTEIPFSTSVGEVVTSNVTIKVTGKVTVSGSSS